MLSAQHKKLIRKTYQNLREQNPSFSPRAAQNKLIAAIAQAIAGEINPKQRILLVESGTGTGKSLAYLLAAIPLALQFHRKLVISTATVALQQQLMTQELPKVHRALEGKFSFHLAKGRQRYCCKHKLKRLSLAPKRQQQAIVINQLWQALKTNQWHGDRDSWPTPIPEAIWQQIQSDSFSCNNTMPRHRQCPFSKARQALQKTDVIITNHSLLIADLERGGGIVLPEPEEVIYIFDEAHLIADITREASLCQLPLKYSLNQLEQVRLWISQINEKLNNGGFIQSRLTALEAIADLMQLLNRLYDFQSQNDHAFEDKIWRFSPGNLPKSIKDLAHNYQSSAQKFQRTLEQFAGQLQEAASDGQITQGMAETKLSQLGPFQVLAENIMNTLYHCQRESDQTPFAYWYERSDQDCTLSLSPLVVGSKLQAILWQRAFAAVALSATLSALGRFDYFLIQTGLYRWLENKQQLRNPSPFNYSQVTLRLSKTFPAPTEQNYLEHLASYVINNYTTGTAMVVLCTSYQLVDDLADSVNRLHPNGVFIQGTQSNEALLKSYRAHVDAYKQGLLIATTGFGEGIDLPGHYLTHLVIPRLPFAVPTDPVTQSHAELLESKGLNPFLQLTLPQTSRKLIQCCGRLMRNESDSGIIAILDSRMVTRRYGQQLLKALPSYQLSYIND
ncbi:ATP-dependent DNA helicase DinG [Celerinatantimonas diazotrophica]|uniref:ATP-dependent DNA helicase DinG n=1 Tax=Celerinatantimonas diazotrophica TaxID=412034 RepID=A0A4R1J7V0_9GAMM|nr:ATP-dependent DNA helicase DinG [Celerinatantimonas diazotrophica]TCK46594.1 ATP-dependent DNA helicase DinG [Celerinatantimonas diazotrophica]CAG9296644.1 ATP-dependent DNA helicase DinG [Celerinatantimonas diazotrophica]